MQMKGFFNAIGRKIIPTLFGLGCIFVVYPAGNDTVVGGFPWPIYFIEKGADFVTPSGITTFTMPLDFLFGLFVYWVLTKLLRRQSVAEYVESQKQIARQQAESNVSE